MEEVRSMPFNLKALNLYIYQDKFILEPNTKAAKIKNNLIINRKTI